MNRHYIIPIFVPHFGCPHACVFCNQKRITGLSTNVTPSDVEKTIEEHLATFKPHSFIEVAFYGGSFTAIDLGIQKKLLEVPFNYKKSGKIDNIRLSTRPDAIDKTILDNLKEYSVDTIELGVQSLDNRVLSVSGRGHSAEDVYKAAYLIKEYGFKLGLQMMIGLPEDDLDKDLYTCKEFIKLRPSCVRVYPTLVIKDTFLEKLYLMGKYKPLSLDEAVEISSLLLMLFNLENIEVIRMGLQPTDNIQLGKDVVAGPFHPSFRQLVESNVFKLLFEYFLKHHNIFTEGKILIIEANNKKISAISGQKSCNIEYFYKKHGFKKIKIYSRDLDFNVVNIIIDEDSYRLDIKSLIRAYLVENLIID